MAIFGGMQVDAIARFTGSGMATYVELEDTPRKVRDAQCAVVVRAPIAQVFDTATDFSHTHEFVSLSKRSKIKPLGPNRFDVTFRQRIGLSLISIGLDMRFRMRLERPHAVHCEEYLGGTMPTATYAMRFEALDESTTLMVFTLHGDLTTMRWLSRVFTRYVPELSAAVPANIVVIPGTAIAAEAERRAGFTGGRAPPPPPITEAIEDPAVQQVLRGGRTVLSLQRLDAQGDLIDVGSATRLAATPERVWDRITDPVALARHVSYIQGGEITRRGPGRIDYDVGMAVRAGPLRKTYRLRLDAQVVEARRLEATRCRTNQVPTVYGEALVPDGDGTLYGHTYYADLKKDGLLKRFMSSHPEFERLLASYPPFIRVFALREAFG